MSARRVLVGLAGVAIGVAFFVDRAGGVQRVLHEIGIWWPLILIALGLVKLFRVRLWAVLGPLILIGLGIAILLTTLGYPEGRLYPLIWPAALALVGFFVAVIGADWSAQRLLYQNRIRQFAWLGAKEFVSRATAFERADIIVVAGYFKLDLTQANLRPSTVVNVIAVFGDVDIIVPRGIMVHTRWPFLLDRSGLRSEISLPPEPVAGVMVSVLGIFAKVTWEFASQRVAAGNEKERSRMEGEDHELGRGERVHPPSDRYLAIYSPEYGDDREGPEPVPVERIADTEVVNLSVNLLGSELKDLLAMAERHGTTLTEAVRRCIATQEWVEGLEEGTRVILEGPGKRHRRVVFR